MAYKQRKMRPVREVVSRNILTLRGKTGLSQGDFAAKAQLSLDVIGRIERAEVTPSLESLEKIAHAFLVPVTELVVASQATESDPRAEELEKLHLYLATRSEQDIRLVQNLARIVLDDIDRRNL